MNFFDPLQVEFWRTIGVAVCCGAIVGFERQVRGKPAGVRTSILICLGTAVFIRLGASIAGEGAAPTRVLGQIVTGVGFLGAGVMFTHGGTVLGVTTAAVIWILAAIGVVIGFGHFWAALLLSVITVTILAGVDWLESSVGWLTRGAHTRKRDDDDTGT